MPDSTAGKMEDEILKKISHPIVDVRIRALRSLLLKLSNNILHPSDLAHNVTFLKNLLEWFNNEPWTCEAHVIQLLGMLSKVEAAAINLVDIGAVEFLSQLRPHLDPGMHASVDGIIENLLQLPASAVGSKNNDGNKSFLNREATTRPCVEDSLAQGPTLDPTSPVPNFSNPDPFAQHYLLHPSPGDQNGYSCVVDHTHPETRVKVSPHTDLTTDLKEDSHSSANQGSLSSHMTSSSCSTYRREKINSKFQWIQLSKVDNHILIETVSRLRSSSSSLMQTYTFVNDVLMKDFPPQIFLQRPAIIKISVGHLSVAVSNSGKKSHDLPVLSAVIDTLLTLSQRLREAIRMSHDLLTCDMELGLTLSADTLRNPPNTTDSDLESLSHDSLGNLMSQALDIPSFSELLFSELMKFLLYCIDTQLPWLHVHAEQVKERSGVIVGVITNGMRLMMLLAEMIISVHSEQDQHKEEGLENKVSLSIHHLSVALSQLTSKMRRARGSGLLPHDLLRLLSPLTLATGTCLSALVSQCIKREKTLSSLSPATCSALKEVFANPVLSEMCSLWRTKLLPFLQCIDKGLAQLYSKEQKMVKSFKHIHNYLSTKNSSDMAPLLCTAEKTLSGMYFNFGSDEETIVKDIVTKSFHCICDVGTESGLLSICRNVLSELVSHERAPVRDTAYQTLKEALAISEADLILSRLFTSSFIQLLCCCCFIQGESQPNRLDVLTWWLSHITLQPEKEREEMFEALMPVLPYLECWASCSTQVFDALINILVNTAHESLPSADKMCSLFRIMFSTSLEVRSKASTQLLKLLMMDSESSWKSLVSKKVSVPFHNILISDTNPSNLPLLTLPIKLKSSSFKREDISKLFSVLRSPSADRVLVQSALEQFGILLQDVSLHQYAIEEGLLAVILQIIHTSTKRTPPPSDWEGVSTLIHPVVSCLLLLSQSSSDIRRALRDDQHLIKDLLMCLLMLNASSSEPHARQLLRELISVLVFTGVLELSEDSSDSTGSRARVPEMLVNQFVFPFAVDPDSKSSPSTPSSPIDHTILSSPPLKDRLLLQYCLSMCGGVDQVPCENSGKGLMIDIHKLKFTSDINSDEKSTVVFDLHCLLYSRPYFLISETKGLKILNLLKDRLQLAYTALLALDWNGLPGFMPSDKSTCFDIKEHFSELLQPNSLERKDISAPMTVLKLVSLFIEHFGSVTDSSNHQWLWGVVTDNNSLCVSILNSCLSSDAWEDNHRSFIESLLLVYSKLLSSPLTVSCPLSMLNNLYQLAALLSDQETYDMFLLQKALHCLVHATAKLRFSQSQSYQLMELCLDLMKMLRKVLCYLLSGRGTMFSSFMGKGATMDAALTLSQIIPLPGGQDWLGSWLTDTGTGTVSGNSLTWLHSLLHDRNPEIRYCGYSILCSLCTQPSSCSIIVSSWRDLHTHGLFGACLDIGLDTSECGLVRQQAISVLVNLLATCHEHSLMDTLIQSLDKDKSVVSGCSAISTVLDSGDFFQTFYTHLRTSASLLEKFIESNPVDQVAKTCFTENKNTDVDNSQLLYETKKLSVFMEFHFFYDPLMVSLLCWFVSSCLQYCPAAVQDNVLKRDTTELLVRMINDLPLKTVLSMYREGQTSTPVVSVWLELYHNVTTLLQYCIRVSTEQEVERACTSLLSLISHGNAIPKDCSNQYDHLCYSVVLLLRTCFSRHSGTVLSLLVTHWNSFTEILCSLLHPPSPPPSHPFILVKESLVLFCTVLSHLRIKDCQSHDSHVSSVLRNTLDTWLNGTEPQKTAHTTPNSSTKSETRPQMSPEKGSSAGNNKKASLYLDRVSDAFGQGSVLCSVVMRAYESVSSYKDYSPEQRKCLKELLRKALCLLVASSNTAKEAALTAGLLETTIENMKCLHTKAMVKLEEHSSSKRKGSHEIPLLISKIEILQNLMFKSTKIKSSSVHSGLVPLVLDMWSLCTLNDPALLRAVLKLLMVYTANCSEAQSSLTSCSKNGSNLLQHLFKTASLCLTSHKSCASSRRRSPHYETLTNLFHIFTNCVLCQECRATLKRVKNLSFISKLEEFEAEYNHNTSFLSSFLSLNSKNISPPSGRKVSIVTLWMRLLVNLTSSTDGQKIVITLPGMINMLCDIWSSDQVDTSLQCLCMMVIRNLCCYPPTKPTVASNEKILTVLTLSLKSHDSHLISLAASGIWALLTNCMRLRSQLRQAHLHEILSTVNSSVKSSQVQGPDHAELVNNVELALSLLTLS